MEDENKTVEVSNNDLFNLLKAMKIQLEENVLETRKTNKENEIIMKQMEERKDKRMESVEERIVNH